MLVLPWSYYQTIFEKKDNWSKKIVLPKAVCLKEKEHILKWSTETDAGNMINIS